MDRLQAVRLLCPGTTGWAETDGKIFQVEDGTPRCRIPSDKAIDEVCAKYSYIELRKVEYPQLVDFADAYVHERNGNPAPMAEYVAKCLAVKQKYPKGE